MKLAGSILMVIAFAAGTAAAALLVGDGAQWPYQEYKELKPDDVGLVDLYMGKADNLRVSWERLLIEERMAPTGRNARDSIIRRYDDIANRWPGTRAAAQARFNIVTMYENTLDMTRVHHAYEKLLKEFPRSEYAMEAHLLVGLAFLDTLKNPSKAVRYFEAVPDPSTLSTKDAATETSASGDGEDTSADVRRLEAPEEYYVNARLHLVKCRVYLEDMSQAERIVTELKERFPEQGERIDAAFVAIKADADDLEKERKGVMKLLRILRE